MHSVRQFELVKALATHRHFGRAATALGVSQPALTRSLKHLEDVLGVPLFDRQGVTPTVFGELMLNYRRAGDQRLRRSPARNRSGQGPGNWGVQRLCGTLFGRYFGAASNRHALRAASRLAVELKLFNWTKIINQVLNGRIDLGFADISEAAENPELETEAVRSSRLDFFCAARHHWLGATVVTLEELCTFPWVGPTAPGRMPQFLPQGRLSVRRV